MGSNFVAHGEDRVPSPIHESPESLQLQKRGNNIDDLPCRHHSDDVEPQPYSLTADWLGLGHEGNATIGCARFRNPDKPGTITDFSRGSTQPRTMVR